MTNLHGRPSFPRIGPLFLVLIYLCGLEQRRSTFRIRIFTLSLGIVSWIRVEGRLVRVSDTPDMDQQVVTVDQFTAAMASIQEALASLERDRWSQASPYVLHGHSEIAPPIVARAVDDTHARMDRIEQRETVRVSMELFGMIWRWGGSVCVFGVLEADMG
ncbi:hypothetical protein AAG906_016663 [Vitis piasezkii]